MHIRIIFNSINARQMRWVVGTGATVHNTIGRGAHLPALGFGNHAFRVARPSVWNSLPADLHHPDLSLGQFCRALKTFLFNQFRSA